MAQVSPKAQSPREAPVEWSALAERIRSGGVEAFLAAHSAPWLVVESKALRGAPIGGETTRLTFDPNLLSQPAKGADTRLCIPLVSRPGSRFAFGVTVGHGEGCDVVLRSPTVSGLHAWFAVSGQPFKVIDSDSRNGTLMDGRPLEKGVQHPLGERHALRFGAVPTVFVTSATLVKLAVRAP